jgi:hypothetical protein
MKVTYQNRYGDNILFEKIDNKTVKMSGYNPKWCRTGYSDASTYNMIDPAGGPYIAVGMNLKHYFETKENMIIESINVKSDHVFFELKSNN